MRTLAQTESSSAACAGTAAVPPPEACGSSEAAAESAAATAGPAKAALVTEGPGGLQNTLFRIEGMIGQKLGEGPVRPKPPPPPGLMIESPVPGPGKFCPKPLITSTSSL